MHKYRWLALIGISFLAFTAFLDFTIVNTALPFIQKELRTNIIQLQWVSNIFGIILSMTMIAVGKVADRLGRKMVFYVGVVFFAIAAFGAGVSGDIEMLIFFRGLQALGASIIFIAASSLLTDTFPKSEYPRAAGIYGGITGLGLVIGPFLGGALISLFSWRWVFWVNLPLIAIGLIFCSFSLRDVKPEKHNVKIDWISLLLLIVGLGAFVYGIVAEQWMCILVGAVTLTALLILDAKKDAPLLQLSIFKNKIIFLALLSVAIAGIVSYVFLFFDPLYLENVRHLSAQMIGLFVLAIPLAQVIISYFFHSLLKLCGLSNLFFISVAAGTLAIVLHRFITPTTPLWYLLIPFLLLGVPWGLSNTALLTAVNQELPARKVGESIGTITTFWNVIGSVFLAISAIIFKHIGTDFMPSFYGATLFNIVVAMIMLVVAAIICLSLKKRNS
jgi:EmrB/QacA subfamily drug resistance transporter